MCFAGRCGARVDVAKLPGNDIESLFNEELGVVLQVAENKLDSLIDIFSKHELVDHVHKIGVVTENQQIEFVNNERGLYASSRLHLESLWSKNSFHIQSLRDNPECAKQEFESTLKNDDPGLSAKLTYNPSDNISASYLNLDSKPRIAVLREQGVNSHVEMAAAFTSAGFDAIDVHMSDLLQGRQDLSRFKGLVACGGFSYGDVLGAGEGWAKTILFNNQVRDAFESFFHREDTFSLGVCNGCQMMSNLKSLIPGAEHWPRFVRNISEQFEARLSLVKIEETASVLLKGMAGSHMPIAVSHGEGRAEFASPQALKSAEKSGTVGMRYIDHDLNVTSVYPANPNGSPNGISSICSTDGRSTIMMPHPERVYRTVANSWHPEEWDEDGAWLRIFRNARVFVD